MTLRNDFESKVWDVTGTVAKLLIEKNKSYGDSALNPIRCFSKLNSLEGIKLRIDDKLSRIRNGNNSFNEDTILDLIGYLVLLKIAEDNKNDDTQTISQNSECSEQV